MRKWKLAYYFIVIFKFVFIILLIIFTQDNQDTNYQTINKKLEYTKPKSPLLNDRSSESVSSLFSQKRLLLKVSSKFSDDGKLKNISTSKKILAKKLLLLRNSQKISREPPLKNIKFNKTYPQIVLTDENNQFANIRLQLDTTEYNVCDKNSTFILAIVPSAVQNLNEREFIRQTWADKSLLEYTRLKAVFLVGATDDKLKQAQVEKEAAKYRDILQINYLDSYRNLTYKTIAALLWISDNCKDIPWILKIDDDVMLNPFTLRITLENELVRDSSPTAIMGRLRPHSKPFKNGKWGIASNEYPDEFYPPFVLGSAYIIGRNAVEKLLSVSGHTPFLYLEDVFTTGILAKLAHVPVKNIEKTHFEFKRMRNLYSGKAIFLVGKSIKFRKYIWHKISTYKPQLI